MKDKFKLRGYARLVCRRKDGSIKWDTGFLRNTITTAGLDEVTGLIGNVGTKTAFTYLAVGTDSTAESSAHTALQAEIIDSGLSRASATVTQETTTETNDTLQLTHTWTATASKTVEEVGIFNDASVGTMLGRKLTGSKTVDANETLTGTYKVVVS
jgi:hypothetical protein